MLRSHRRWVALLRSQTRPSWTQGPCLFCTPLPSCRLTPCVLEQGWDPLHPSEVSVPPGSGASAAPLSPVQAPGVNSPSSEALSRYRWPHCPHTPWASGITCPLLGTCSSLAPIRGGPSSPWTIWGDTGPLGRGDAVSCLHEDQKAHPSSAVTSVLYFWNLSLRSAVAWEQ